MTERHVKSMPTIMDLFVRKLEKIMIYIGYNIQNDIDTSICIIAL